MYISKPHQDFVEFKDNSRISPSSLKQFFQCPYYYWASRVAKFWEDEGNEHFLLGGAADSLITEGREDYEKKYQIADRRTQALKEQAEKNGVELLTLKQAEIVEGMYKELNRQPLFAKFNTEGWVKQAWLETDIIDEFDNTKVHAVGKLDYYHRRAQVIADLKTTANLNTFHPAMYALQMGMYHEIARLVDGIDAQVFIIGVDKTTTNCPVPRSRIYLISENLIALGKDQMRRAIEMLKVCRETNGWDKQVLDDIKPHECPVYDTCPYGIQKRIFTV